MLNTSVRLSRRTITSPPKVRRVVGIACQFFIECAPTIFKQKAKINNILIYESIKLSPVTLKSIPWTLADFYYNRGLQRSHTRTCTILQETINRFLCPLIVFLKSKTHQLNLKDVTELNRNLRIKLFLAGMNARQYNYCYMVLAEKTCLFKEAEK